MKIKQSYLFAGGIAAAVALFFIVGDIVGMFSKDDKKAASEAAAPKGPTVPLVQVAMIPEAQRAYIVSVRGRTEANKTVIVRAETAGPVAATPARDIEKNAKAMLSSMLGRLDLVTRDEFDVQTQVLARTREKLTALEARVEALEKQRAAQ